MSRMEEQDFSNKKIDLSLWKQLYQYALKNRSTIGWILTALVMVSLIDVLYPLFTSFAIDRFIVPRKTTGAISFTVVYAIVVLLQGLGVILFVTFCGKLEMRMAYDIRQDAFQKLQTLSFSFYDHTAVGYLMARVVSDVGRLSEMVAWSFVDVLWSLLYILGSMLSMFLLNAKLALLVLAVVPPLAWISIRLQRKILHYQRQARKQNSKITGAFNEGIMGAVTTKTLVLEERSSQEFSDTSSAMKHISVKSALVSAAFFPIIISLGALGTAMALTVGGNGVLHGTNAWIGLISAGTLVAFISYSTQLFDPIQQLANILAELLGAQASAERVMTLIHTQSDIVDTPDVVLQYGDILHPKQEHWQPLQGDIQFEHVSFAYQTGEEILKDFCLHVKAGETIALVGETGAGKSTIVNLLCRFYEPTDGRILVDGTDYRLRSQLWLQSNLGYVLQAPHLFSGTIADNIRYGVPEASDEQVYAAAKMIGANEFIEKLPCGYDTEVGEAGGRLSTGQKQLLCFARVILKNPRIFVLDEATSSIDTEAELMIQQAMQHVLTGRTSFIIAHRLSTIRSADRILVIHDGAISEAGSHTALMAQKGAYYKLYTQQFREQETLDSLH